MKFAYRIIVFCGLAALISCQSDSGTPVVSSMAPISVDQSGWQWEGSILSGDGTQLQVRVRETSKLEVHYPSLKCKVRLEQITRDLNTVQFIQVRTEGPDNCAPAPRMQTSMAGRTAMSLTLQDGTGAEVGKGMVYKGSELRRMKSTSGSPEESPRYQRPLSISPDLLSVTLKNGAPTQPKTKSGTYNLLVLKGDYTETTVDIPVNFILEAKEPARLGEAGKTLYVSAILAYKDEKGDITEKLTLPGNGSRCGQYLFILNKDNGYRVNYNFTQNFAIRSNVTNRTLLAGEVVNSTRTTAIEHYEITGINAAPFKIKRYRRDTCLGNATLKEWPGA